MKVICNGATPDDVAVYTDDGIDITKDLGVTSIALILEAGETNKLVLTCLATGLYINTSEEAEDIQVKFSQSPEDPDKMDS